MPHNVASIDLFDPASHFLSQLLCGRKQSNSRGDRFVDRAKAPCCNQSLDDRLLFWGQMDFHDGPLFFEKILNTSLVQS